jgi:hypothetical protein
VGAVVNQAGNVVLGHLGELLLKDALQAGHDDEAVLLAIVVDNAKLDLAVALLDDGGLSRNVG